MAGRISAATERALRMVQRGTTPLQAAIKQGIAPSTLYMAMKRMGIEATKKPVETKAVAND